MNLHILIYSGLHKVRGAGVKIKKIVKMSRALSNYLNKSYKVPVSRFNLTSAESSIHNGFVWRCRYAIEIAWSMVVALGSHRMTWLCVSRCKDTNSREMMCHF